MAELDDRLRTAYNSYNDEYNELCDTWKALDQKAQGSLQIAGIMIALLAGFATKTCEPLFGGGAIARPVIILSGVAFLSLWACVLSALWALWVQRVSHSPRGSGWCDVESYTATQLLDEQVANDILRRRLVEWRQTNKDVWRINESKANYLLWSQRLLACGSGAVTAAALAFLVRQLWT